MADTYTTNLNLTKPEPGAAEDTWGISLNSDLDTLDAIFSSSGTQVNLNPNQVNFADNKKAIFGTGSDLQIYHDGTHSVIDDVGTGNLILQTNGTQITLQSSSEYFVTAQNNGAVTLYHNGSAKLATTSTGIDVTGNIGVGDSHLIGDDNFDNLALVSSSGENIIVGASNDIYFTTGATSLSSTGTTKLIVKDNGNIGIGTTAPADELHVNGSGDTAIRVTTSSTSLEPKLVFVDGSGDYASLEKVNRDIKIKAFNTDVAYFTNGGSVGIGTSSPNAKLTLQNGLQRINSTDGSSDARILFSMVDGSNTPSSWIGIPNWNKDGFYIFGPTANGNESAAFYTGANWVFQTGGTERLRIDASGFVGIGTSSPQKALNVSANNSAPVRLERNTSDGQVIQIYKDGSAVSSIGTNSIGIGTSLPAAAIHAQSSTAEANRSLRLSYDGTYYFDLRQKGAGGIVYNAVNASSGGHRWQLDGSEKARIDTSGNLLVGKTSTSVATVGAKMSSTGQLTATVSSDIPLALNRTTNDGDIAQFRKNNTVVGSIGTNSGYIRIGTDDTHLLYHSGIDTIIPYSGSANRDDAISLGYSGARFKDLYLSGKAQADTYQFAQNSSATGVTDAIYRATTSTIAFKTGSSERMRLNTTGLGIGTSSPAAKLDVRAADGNGISLNIGRSDTGSYFKVNHAGNDLRIYNTDGTGQDILFGVDAAGTDQLNKVGIGTASPSSPLTVESAFDYVANFRSTDTTAGILLTDSNGQCRVTNTNGNLILSSDVNNEVANSAIRFMLDTTSNAGGSAKVVIREAGLGINTASPSNPLHVYHATTDTVARFESGDASVAVNFIASDNSMQISTSGTDGIIKNDGAGNFRLFNNGSERVRINSAGNVGIGNTSPQEKLTIGGANSQGDIGFHIGGHRLISFGFMPSNSSGVTYAGYPTEIRHDPTAGTLRLGIDGTSRSVGDTASITNVLAITKDHRVGVGTLSPINKLDVRNGNIMVGGYGSGNDYGLVFTPPDSSTYWHIYNDTGGNLAFGRSSTIGNTERMRIDSSGNVLIGTTTNEGSGGVSIGQNATIYARRTGGEIITLRRDSTDGALINFQKDGTATGSISTAAGVMTLDAPNGNKHYVANSALFPSANNILDLGTSSQAYKNLYLSSNIILSGTSANEGYIALPDSDLPTSTTHKLYHSNDTLFWNGESIDTTSTSDYRAKKDIQPLKDGLQRVNKLNPVEFRYIEDDKYSEGFIAHELQEVWEHGVHGEKDGDIMQSVSYGRITPLLVKAIQEQQEQIESLKSEIAKLKGE